MGSAERQHMLASAHEDIPSTITLSILTRYWVLLPCPTPIAMGWFMLQGSYQSHWLEQKV